MIVLYKADRSNFTELGIVTSVSDTVYYYDIGKFTVVVQKTAKIIEFLEPDSILYDTERNLSFTVQDYEFNGPNIAIHGYTSEWLLDKRVVAAPVTIKDVEADAYAAVTENLRELPGVTVAAPAGLTETAEALIEGGQLLSSLLPTLKAAGIGSEMLWNPSSREHIFRLYKGRDLTEGIHAVTFSREQGTASGLVFTSDTSVFKNVVYVRAELSSGNEITEIVGDTAAPDRRELWLNNTMRQQPDETEAELRARMRQTGLEEIAERVKRDTFDVIIPAEEYGKAYRLGDVVRGAALELGIVMTARICGARYTRDARRGQRLNLILGEPVLTALKEAKLNGNY